jgi:phenylacetaldehyde dehydrogenase
MAATHLELSASNPVIVTADADLDVAADELARGTLVLNGQWCEAPRRVYVHQSIHNDLASRLLAELSRRVIADPTKDSTELGPLAYRAQFEGVVDAVARLGATGQIERATQALPTTGYFMAPTLVVDLSPAAVDHEIFGPVLAISPYTQLTEALEAANGLGDGLAAYVFSGDREQAFSIGAQLHAGEVRLGGTRVLDLAEGSAQSFWGTSGAGGHGVTDVLQAHTGIRIVGEEDYNLAL